MLLISVFALLSLTRSLVALADFPIGLLFQMAQCGVEAPASVRVLAF